MLQVHQVLGLDTRSWQNALVIIKLSVAIYSSKGHKTHVDYSSETELRHFVNQNSKVPKYCDIHPLISDEVNSQL